MEGQCDAATTHCPALPALPSFFPLGGRDPHSAETHTPGKPAMWDRGGGPHTRSAADLSSGGIWRELHKLWVICLILALLGCEGTNCLSFLGCLVIKNMGT